MKKEFYLAAIRTRIADILGLQFQLNQSLELEKRLIQAANELKMESSISKIFEWLSKSEFSKLELKALSAHLTINESYFFREKPALELFVHQIIPELILQRTGKSKHIRIWSAGCSSGEEPYTLAILLKEHFPELVDWNITILATDISPIAIQKALLGVYTDWSFRETDPAIKKTYFRPSNKKWNLVPEIKKMVSFSYLNLAENAFPSVITNTQEMDVVFCRNVMMYFTPQVIQDVSARFKASLNENGWLITSQVELNDAYFSNFEKVHFRNGIFYQKRNKPKTSVKKTFEILEIQPKLVQKADRIKKRIPEEKPSEENESETIDPEHLFKKGHYSQCIDTCLHLIDTGKITNDIFSMLVKSYANSGLLSDAQTIIAKIMELNCVTPEMYYIYASLWNEQNDWEQAAFHLKKAIYLNHKHVLAHLMLGQVFQKEGKNKLAYKTFETTIELLDEYDENDIVPESEGITAGRIQELTAQIMKKL